MKRLFGLLVIVAMVAFAACSNGEKKDAAVNVDSLRQDSIKKVEAAAAVKVDTTAKVDTTKKTEEAANPTK